MKKAALIILLPLAACSGSVLVDAPAVPKAPPGQHPNGGSEPLGAFQMKFSLQPDEEVYEDAFPLLFNPSELDPFEVSEFSEARVALKVRAVNAEKNVTTAQAQMTMNYEGNESYMRDFKLATKTLSVVRKEKDNLDYLDGTFVAENSKSNETFFLVILTRKSSLTPAELANNPWRGELLVKTNNKEYKLGNLSGFLELLAE